MLSSFFLTNKTRIPQDDELGRINYFPIRSAKCFFNSANSASTIRYNALAIGAALDSIVIVKRSFLDGGNPSKGLNTLLNSQTFRISSSFYSPSNLLPQWSWSQDTSPSIKALCACKAVTIDIQELGFIHENLWRFPHISQRLFFLVHNLCDPCTPITNPFLV